MKKYGAWYSLDLIILASLGFILSSTAQAQITPDGTTSTTVNREGDNFTIEQGDRLARS